MPKTSGSYETLAIFSLRNGDEAAAALVEKFKALIGEHGTISNVEEWGKRRLAYPIEDETEGFYLFVEFTAAPAFPAELDRIYKITDGVLRSLIIAKNS
jgi:small subunit ribosomal protein S6